MTDPVQRPIDRVEDRASILSRKTDTSPVAKSSQDSVSLGDKYDLEKSRVFISGQQAVVRLLMMQAELDRRSGLNTAGFVSGYRGSPLGGLDLNLQRAKKHLDAFNIVFQPGLNEDLAATAIWGAQQAEMRGEGRFDGVFSLWYGKGPGVDRSGDVFRHANLAGTSKHGGVLALMGDDHTAESSTTAHQSEFTFIDSMMPIFSPAGVQEILDYGLMGYALSRYASTWVGLKCLKDTIESTATIDASFGRVIPLEPADFALPATGLNIRPNDGVLDQEIRLQTAKFDAMLAWLRLNKMNRIVLSGGPKARVGVIAAGKSYLDVRQGLDDLGIDETRANDLGLRLYKIGCVWPLEPDGLRDFARGLDMIIVVEEKRSLIEMQVREHLYGTAHQPILVGKKDEHYNWLFPVSGSLDANDIAIAIGSRLLRFTPNADLGERLRLLEAAQTRLESLPEFVARAPFFCSGCPHNTSTNLPEGARAYSGIGCHYMVQTMDRATEGYTHMGGEGANWIGEAPFSTRPHIFQNLGDGTYNHSGSLALRFAVASKVNITFKILFNDAVAMTGGQRHEGGLTVDMIARQVAAENVSRIVVVTDEPHKYPPSTQWPAGTTIHSRADLDAVQQELADVAGTSVLIYDQTCAAEKRRRRKRGEEPDPQRRVFINSLVCEGCGDCSVKSNCVSIQPLETEFGRKRTIDQSSCNKDFSCLDGFCPAIVSVDGATVRKAQTQPLEAAPGLALPAPQQPILTERPYGILVTGVGGTGVVTIGAILGMAAHLEGKACGIIDMAGLSQKGGSVFSHVKIAATKEDIRAVRVGAAGADLILGCDLIVSGGRKVLGAMRHNETGVVVNSANVYPGEITRDADFYLPAEQIKRAIAQAGGSRTHLFDATRAAKTLLGNTIGANMMMLGFAWQQGLLPLNEGSILRAIELNGEEVALNKAAFAWGRRQAVDPTAVEAAIAARGGMSLPPADESLEQTIERRVEFLQSYGGSARVERYRALVSRAAEMERAVWPSQTRLTETVARQFFKLIAIKDEYEVGRLYTDGNFARELAATFEGDVKLSFHLAPPLIARKNAKGEAIKMTFGPWMYRVFKLLAALRPLRGTAFDIFGYTKERRMEYALIAHYESLMLEVLAGLAKGNYELAIALADLPERIRGFGHVRLQSVRTLQAKKDQLLAQFRQCPDTLSMAAE
jgi:indolepyruvate ferredoxin oxidoreductase